MAARQSNAGVSPICVTRRTNGAAMLMLSMSLATVAGCSPPGRSADAATAASSASAPVPAPGTEQLVNKVWRVTAPATRAPGSVYIFLAGGTLFMNSCVETYRLATWKAETTSRLSIAEDETTRYAAAIDAIDERTLSLRLLLKGEEVPLKLEVAPTPYVCPDLPKSAADPATGAGASGGADATAKVNLTGTAWRLDDLAGAGVVPKAEATLEFFEPGRVAGRGSCNRFFGSVEITGDRIKFGPIGSTRMACLDEAVAKQEASYFKALEAAERFEQKGDALLIYVAGEQKPLRFARRASEKQK